MIEFDTRTTYLRDEAGATAQRSGDFESCASASGGREDLPATSLSNATILMTPRLTGSDRRSDTRNWSTVLEYSVDVGAYRYELP